MEYVFDKWVQEKVIKKVNIYQRYTLLSALLTGIAAHGFMLFQKISYRDDLYFYFGVGDTFSSGRWGLGILKAVNEGLGLGHYSMPLWNGLLSIVLLALCAMLIVGIFQIQNKIYAVLIGAYMVSFPVVTSTFAYMFTAPYYFFAALCMVLAVWFTKRYQKGFFCGISLITFGMGIYQAYFGVATAVFVMLLLKEFAECTFAENFRCAVKYFLTLVGGITGYFLMNKLCLSITNTVLSDYQGISGLSNISMAELLNALKKAYFIYPELLTEDFVGLTNGSLIRILYGICFFITAVLAVLLFRQIKGGISNKILYGMLLAVIPLSISVIFVMAFSDETVTHTLMVYAFVFIAIYPMVLLQILRRLLLEGKERKLTEYLHGIICVTVAAMTIFYMRLDHAAYLQANYQQENAIAYFTVLMSEIKGTEGYKDEYPVAFLGAIDGIDTSIAWTPEFQNITLQGYNMTTPGFMDYYANIEFMRVHCGYTYTVPDNLEEIAELEEVAAMPCYPDQGSIKVIDGVVVVKFSEYRE